MRNEATMFGYTARENAFLRLAGLLSGYFVRRQFNEFIGKECGAVGQRFVERGVRLGHIEPLSALGGRVVYHVCSSSLYAALGEADNRNRREHQPDTVRVRLLALDYALGNSAGAWLLTEQSKLDYFASQGIPTEDLPFERFRTTRRAFVDKHPIRISTDSRVEVCFVDEGLRTFSKWVGFLKSHRALVQRLALVDVVFAAHDERRFSAAAELFRRTVAGETAAGELDLSRLSRYFELRRLFDQKRFEVFDQSRLDELREYRRVFAGPEYDGAYGSWLNGGTAQPKAASPAKTRFRTFKLPHSYGWLSPVRIEERRA